MKGNVRTFGWSLCFREKCYLVVEFYAMAFAFQLESVEGEELPKKLFHYQSQAWPRGSTSDPGFAARHPPYCQAVLLSDLTLLKNVVGHKLSKKLMYTFTMVLSGNHGICSLLLTWTSKHFDNFHVLKTKCRMIKNIYFWTSTTCRRCDQSIGCAGKGDSENRWCRNRWQGCRDKTRLNEAKIPVQLPLPCVPIKYGVLNYA